MTAFEDLSVSLPSDVADVIQNAVTSGAYASADEVVREALREWTARRLGDAFAAADIRRLWQEGIDSGPGRFTDLAAVKQEARRRLAETKQAPR